MKIQQSNVQRCPFCHSSIVDMAGELIACKCTAIYHSACASQLAACASCNTKMTAHSSRLSLLPDEENSCHMPELAKRIWADPKFEDAYKLVRANSKGKLWAIGGKVYRNLLELSFEEDFGSKSCDFDFLCEKLTWFRHIPKELLKEVTVEYAYSTGKEMRNPFTKTTNELDRCPRFISNDLSVDLISIKKARGIIENKLPKTINGYLAGVPLDIQACVLDLQTEIFHFNNNFRQAYLSKTVDINNHNQVMGCADRKGISQGEYVRRKADSIKFKSFRKNPTKLISKSGELTATQAEKLTTDKYGYVLR